MKAITIILATLFTLHMNVLTAGNDIVVSAPASGTSTLNLSALIPATPAEATFEEMTMEIPAPGALAPVSPDEAEFEEVSPVADPVMFAPVTPAEAEFEEIIPVADPMRLAPVTPAEADFE